MRTVEKNMVCLKVVTWNALKLPGDMRQGAIVLWDEI